MGLHFQAKTIANVAISGSEGVPKWPWTAIANIKEINGSSAQMLNTTPGKISEDAFVKDFGFTIPDGSVIEGILINVKRNCTEDADPFGFKDDKIALLKAGVEVGDNKADAVTFWPIVAANAQYGGDSDLWGTSWTPAEINDSGFGIVLAILSACSLIETAQIDGTNITVYYRTPGEDFMGFFG